jgi:hypothetical protein
LDHEEVAAGEVSDVAQDEEWGTYSTTIDAFGKK